MKTDSTTKYSLDSIRAEFELTGKNHLDMATSIRTDIERPLVEFLSNQNSVRKSVSVFFFFFFGYFQASGILLCHFPSFPSLPLLSFFSFHLNTSTNFVDLAVNLNLDSPLTPHPSNPHE